MLWKFFLQCIFLKVAIKCLFTHYKDFVSDNQKAGKSYLLLLKDTVSTPLLVYADSADPSSDIGINGFQDF